MNTSNETLRDTCDTSSYIDRPRARTGKTGCPVTSVTPAPTAALDQSGRKYGVIYADPPWLFRTWSAKGTGRSAVSHYDCLDFPTLAALPVAQLAADDCVLFLWATNPSLPRALELIHAWGFEYKTLGFCWVKLNKTPKHDAHFFVGMGYWTRANPELCLLATRGKPPRQAKDVRCLVVDPRREHSRKPDCIRERIERLVPGPYVELFARETKKGWDCWGNQVGLFDHGPMRTRRQPSRLVDARTAAFRPQPRD
jgi:N6-adenosine-specific RNA methylase IME4